VQEQNAATRQEIADLARRFRSQPFDFPSVVIELTARKINVLSGILAKLEVVPEQQGDFLSGYWLAADRTFNYFELQLNRNDPASIEVEVWEAQPQLQGSAHERGIGKSFACLALEVLDDMNSRSNKSLQRTREG
jgi:hypothetical protein